MCGGEANTPSRDPMEEECCSRGRMRHFVEPCLLLLLVREPTYGYHLMEKLELFGFSSPDPGSVYRCLRGLEERGMVVSQWETEGSGPARRSYRLTPEGRELLEAWVVAVDRQKQALETFLQEYRLLQGTEFFSGN